MTTLTENHCCSFFQVNVVVVPILPLRFHLLRCSCPPRAPRFLARSSFRSVLLNLLHQRFGFAFDSFVLPLSFSSSLFVAVSGAAFAGTGSVHLGGGAFLRSHPDLAIWSVFSWMQQEYFLLPLAPLHHMNYVVTDIVDVEASLQKFSIQSLPASDAVPASAFG